MYQEAMRYQSDQLKNFCFEVFLTMNFNSMDAEQASDVLIKSDQRGISSHGLLRLPEYYTLWKEKRLNADPRVQILREKPSTALLDGDGGSGLVIAPYAMDLAIKKAKTTGAAWVSVKNSNHFGIAGYHAMKALDHNMIGIAMTNANPLVAPTFSKNPLLGTNPLAVAIPAGNEPPFIADFASAPIARGKLDILAIQGKQAPELLLQDNDGHATCDPSILGKGGSIKTLGGDYQRGNHKGYCLSAIIDILSAVLPGANFSAVVIPTLSYVKGTDKGKKENGIGHFFGAIDIEAFRDINEFFEYMDEWITTFRNASVINEEESVLIPGDPERMAEKRNNDHGIPLLDDTVKKLRQLAKECMLSFPDAIA